MLSDLVIVYMGLEFVLYSFGARLLARLGRAMLYRGTHFVRTLFSIILTYLGLKDLGIWKHSIMPNRKKRRGLRESIHRLHSCPCYARSPNNMPTPISIPDNISCTLCTHHRPLH